MFCICICIGLSVCMCVTTYHWYFSFSKTKNFLKDILKNTPLEVGVRYCSFFVPHSKVWTAARELPLLLSTSIGSVIARTNFHSDLIVNHSSVQLCYRHCDLHLASRVYPKLFTNLYQLQDRLSQAIVVLVVVVIKNTRGSRMCQYVSVAFMQPVLGKRPVTKGRPSVVILDE